MMCNDHDLQHLARTGFLPDGTGATIARGIGTELLAARRELAELRRERDRLDEENRAAAPLLEMVRTRPLREGDEYIAITAHGEWTLHRCYRGGPIVPPACRVVRVDLPAAAPESAPAPIPFPTVDSTPALRHATFAEVAERMCGIPEHIINAPPQHVTATAMGLAESAPAEKAGPSYIQRARDLEAEADRQRHLAPAPPPEPVETDDGLTAYQRLCGVTPKQPKPLPQHLADLLAEKCQTYRPGRDWHDDADDYMEARTPQPEPVRDGDFVRATKAERDAHLDAMHDEARRRNMPSSDTYDPSRPTHWIGSGKPPTKPTLDELQRAAAERQAGRLTDKVKHLERKIQAQRHRICVLEGRKPKPARVLGAAPLNIPPTHTTAKQPEPPAEGADVNQLRFIAALGADGDVPVHSLSSMMSLNRARTHRCMAVEIARRRLAEMDAAKPAEGAGETLRQAVNKRHGWPVERHISDARVPWCETGADIGRFRAALRRVAYESDDFDSRVIALDALLGYGGGR